MEHRSARDATGVSPREVFGHDAGNESSQASAWFARQRTYPLKAIPANAWRRALAQVAALQQALPWAHSATDASGSFAAGTWQHVGLPAQQSDGSSIFSLTTATNTVTQSATTNYGSVGGRVTALAADPTNGHTLYAGTAGGGVWKTTDGGGSWTPTTDAQPSLSIGAMAIAPTAPYTIYAMTGEGNYGSDSYYGVGLLQSTDGARHWTLTGTDLAGLSSSRLVVDPVQPSILYAAMSPNRLAQGLTSSGGIYRSTDGGATWTLSLNAGSPAASAGCAAAPSFTPIVPGTDIAVAVTGQSVVVYAALGAPFGCTANGVYQSADHGQTWTRLAGFDRVAGSKVIDSFGTTDAGRIALAVAPSNPSVLYAAVQNASDNTLQGVYRSPDAGMTWSALALPNDLGSGDKPADQYWFDLYIAVNPLDSGTVYLGGVDVWKGRITAAGTTWANLTNGYANSNDNYQPGSVHPDQHALVFAADGAIYAGNDGGVYKTSDGGSTWSNCNTGLDALQLYAAAVSTSAQGTLIYRGAQDNGISRFDGTGPWTTVVGNDGTLSAIDPTNADIAYVALTQGRLFKTTDRGHTWTPITGRGGTNDPASDSRLGVVAPLVLDHDDASRLLMGTYRLWQSTDGGATWNLQGSGQDLTAGSVQDTISALAIAPTISSTIYAGTTNGRVQVTTDDGGSWAIGTGLPHRSVTSIAVSPASARVAWVAVSGFDEATPPTPGHIFLTGDGGHTWTDVSGNLPDVPVNALALDPATGALYAGTDLGAFVALGAAGPGTTWAPLGHGLPNAPVYGLTLGTDGTLYAATHGRGLWSLRISAGTSNSGATSAGLPGRPARPSAGCRARAHGQSRCGARPARASRSRVAARPARAAARRSR